MERESLYLWCANPQDVLREANIETYVSMLDESERAHGESYRFKRHRDEYMVTRVLVRTALSHYYPLSAAAWRFESNGWGKPVIVPECGLRFNVSNCPGLVVCLISRGSEVGVDAEPYESGERIVELGSEVFSPPEMAQLAGLQGDERSNRALSLWTLKESYFKARGIGLSPNQASFLYGGPEGLRLQLDQSLNDSAERWRFCLLELAGHLVAVMTQSANAFDLQLFSLPSFGAMASCLPGGSERWFPLARAVAG